MKLNATLLQNNHINSSIALLQRIPRIWLLAKYKQEICSNKEASSEKEVADFF